ncbi:MAG: hypothetical protein MI867_08045, partial [Pseudomonadales bacterium]|nr:hypothetical protein [Pseudomonadales bacterium]
VAVIMSFGILRRVAISSEKAQEIYERYPKSRGKLLLVLDGHRFVGNSVFFNVPLVWAYWISFKLG